MPLDEPWWWYRDEPGVAARLLSPFASIYGRMALARYGSVEPYRSKLPVVCVGNFTAGGTGKTPLAACLVRLLVEMGERPAILTRGYGGRLRGPVWVDRAHHGARDVGDEALLHARTAPTIVSRDREAGVRAIEAATAPSSVIVMDDGLQNPALVKDLSFAVVDGRRGTGNGLVIPAGPLRAPLDAQLGWAGAIVINRQTTVAGADDAASVDRLIREFSGPVIAGRPVPAGDYAWLAGRPVIAYAGIANPQRFFDLAAHLGAELKAKISYADHHSFSEDDASQLLALSEQRQASLVTTEKDLVRLVGAKGPLGELARRSRAIAIELEITPADRETVRTLIAEALARAR